MPALTFLAVATTPFKELLEVKFILAYTAVTLLVFAGVFVVFKTILRRSTVDSIFPAVCTTLSNSALASLPILLHIFGHKAIIPVTITIIVVILIYVPLITFDIESSTKKTGSLTEAITSALVNTLKNPLVLSAFLGVFFYVNADRNSVAFDTFLHYLGDATIGTALVLIGVQLGDVKLSEGLGEITFVSIICVIFRPLFAIFIAHYFQFSTFYAVVLMLVSAGKAQRRLASNRYSRA